jgi:uncharacterized protein YndB with AHSA1/START domain
MAARSNYKAEITLPSDRELVVRRVFDAPPHLVYQAWTDAQLVPRWWCCTEGYVMPVCDMDVRVGGSYRWVMRGHGQDHAFYGEYRELVPGAKIVMTQIYAPYPEEQTVVTLSFEEKDGKTVFLSHSLYTTQAGRDGHIASGMERGMNAAFDLLDELAHGAAMIGASRIELPRAQL